MGAATEPWWRASLFDNGFRRPGLRAAPDVGGNGKLAVCTPAAERARCCPREGEMEEFAEPAGHLDFEGSVGAQSAAGFR